jgi:hypothetical protein
MFSGHNSLLCESMTSTDNPGSRYIKEIRRQYAFPRFLLAALLLYLRSNLRVSSLRLVRMVKIAHPGFHEGLLAYLTAS